MFNFSGWIGVSSIIVFNIGCLLAVLVNLVQHCCLSNRESIRQIRKDYYYQKILKYESSYACDISKDMLDSWVIKGDLN
jgi:hypothetical protein